MMFKNNIVLYTVLTPTKQTCSCVYFPLCDKDIFQTEVIQTVIYHSRELSLRTEVEESDKDECPTNAISNSSSVSSGTWTEIGTLNRGQASRFFFSPYFRKTIMLKMEWLLVCQYVYRTEEWWNLQAWRPVCCLRWHCCLAASWIWYCTIQIQVTTSVHHSVSTAGCYSYSHDVSIWCNQVLTFIYSVSSGCVSITDNLSIYLLSRK